jgi:hypothetical protein
MYVLIVALLAFFVALPASAQVQVDIGVNFQAPPPLEVVPEVSSVQYVPSANANLFFYGGQYWAYNNGGWYYSGGYNGPWVVANPEFVPQPLLIVPVTYYRRPPPAWRSYQGGRPPQWGGNYGRQWHGKREVLVPAHHEPGRDVHAQPAARPMEHAAVREAPHAEPAREQPHPAAREPAREERPAEHGEEGHH